MEMYNSNILSTKRLSYKNSNYCKNTKKIDFVAELDKILKKISFLEQFVSKSGRHGLINCKKGHSEEIVDKISNEITYLVKSINSSKNELGYIEKEKTEYSKNIRETEKKTIIEHKKLKKSAIKIDELKNENIKLKEKIEKDLVTKTNKKKLEINKKEKLLFEMQQQEQAIIQEKNNLINYIKNLENQNLEIISNTLISISQVQSQLQSQIISQKSVCDSLKNSFEYINNQKEMVEEDIRCILEMRADFIAQKEEYEKELDLLKDNWWKDTEELLSSGFEINSCTQITVSSDKYYDFTTRYFYCKLTTIVMQSASKEKNKMMNHFKKIINNISQKVFNETIVKKYLNRMLKEVKIKISDNDLEKLKEKHMKERGLENQKLIQCKIFFLNRIEYYEIWISKNILKMDNEIIIFLKKLAEKINSMKPRIQEETISLERLEKNEKEITNQIQLLNSNKETKNISPKSRNLSEKELNKLDDSLELLANEIKLMKENLILCENELTSIENSMQSQKAEIMKKIQNNKSKINILRNDLNILKENSTMQIHKGTQNLSKIEKAKEQYKSRIKEYIKNYEKIRQAISNIISSKRCYLCCETKIQNYDTQISRNINSSLNFNVNKPQTQLKFLTTQHLEIAQNLLKQCPNEIKTDYKSGKRENTLLFTRKLSFSPLKSQFDICLEHDYESNQSI